MKVYDYEVDGSRHCREGVATEERPGVLFDTFWTNGDRHKLTETEATSARFRFDTDDFIELDANRFDNADQWNTFAPGDRQTITSQQGLQVRYFVRTGAAPDLATQIENARQKVSDAERAERSATSALTWARSELRALEDIVGAPGPSVTPNSEPTRQLMESP